MATSNSTERCTASASIYSGRANPAWPLSESSIQELEGIWKNLKRAASARPDAPGLGYRGCTVDCGPRGRWIAFERVVGWGKEYRADPGRQFERAVLESAPEGLIPAEVLQSLK